MRYRSPLAHILKMYLQYFVFFLCLDRWHTSPPPKDVLLLSLSSSACEMLLFVKGRLQILQEQLAGRIFNSFWKVISQALNMFIFEEVNFIIKINERALGSDKIHNYIFQVIPLNILKALSIGISSNLTSGLTHPLILLL